MAVPDKKLCSQLFFQVFKLTGKRRLGYMQSICSLCYASFPGNR